jgi:GAF domain-containing protein
VAEAVKDGADKIADAASIPDLRTAPTVRFLAEKKTLLIQGDLASADPPVPPELMTLYQAKAQMLAPLVRDGRLVGVISVHDTKGARTWTAEQTAALEQARKEASATLDAEEQRGLLPADAALQDAALDAILERVRTGLAVQRCTLRQDVSTAFAFPVTHEARAEDTRSLKGDLTIPQSNQPVIEHMLATREQVVQDDTAAVFADNPPFESMLRHYGGMRAQIVTPIFAGDRMVAVLSIHDLHAPRHWSENEKRFAARAADLLGAVLRDRSG